MPILLIHFDPDEVPEELLGRVDEIAPGYEVVVSNDREKIAGLLDEIEIVAGGGPYEPFVGGKNLRWVQQWGAGADWLERAPAAARADFVLTSVSGVHAIPISEHIFAFLLAFARQLPKAFRDQQKHEWHHHGFGDVFELHGKTLLMVGVGAIGEQAARVGCAIGMRVMGVRRHPEQGADCVAEMYAPEDLPELLPQADFVALTVPLTSETRGMIGEQELKAMKPSAYIVNIGRGGTIDQDALVQALREGWIAGAGLDVTDPEPLPPDSPLWEMPNVIITAHYSGLTPHYNERAIPIFLENLRRYVSGESLQNVVDKELGY